MKINEVTYSIIEEAIYLHRKLGPGLLVSVYEDVLCYRILKKGHQVHRQKPIPCYFEEIKMDIGFRADLIVDEQVLVELKSQENIHPVSYKKLLTYLRLSKLSLGLFINFHELLLKRGIRRVANNYAEYSD